MIIFVDGVRILEAARMDVEHADKWGVRVRVSWPGSPVVKLSLGNGEIALLQETMLAELHKARAMDRKRRGKVA